MLCTGHRPFYDIMTWKKASYIQKEPQVPWCSSLWSYSIPIYPQSLFPNIINEYGQRLNFKHIHFGETHSNNSKHWPAFLAQMWSKHMLPYFWHITFLRGTSCIELSFVTSTHRHDLVNSERYYLPHIINMTLGIKFGPMNIWQRHLSPSNFTLMWSRPQSALSDKHLESISLKYFYVWKVYDFY